MPQGQLYDRIHTHTGVLYRHNLGILRQTSPRQVNVDQQGQFRHHTNLNDTTDEALDEIFEPLIRYAEMKGETDTELMSNDSGDPGEGFPQRKGNSGDRMDLSNLVCRLLGPA